MTQEPLQSLRGYVLHGYSWINTYLRDKQTGRDIPDHTAQDRKRAVMHIDSLMEKAQKDMVLYRGLECRSLLRTGTVISDGAYISTSTGRMQAKRFMARRGVFENEHSCLFEIHVPQSHPLIPVYEWRDELIQDRDHTSYKMVVREKEYLLSRETKLIITKVRRRRDLLGAYWHVTCIATA